MIYLDASALMKLVRREAETEALGEWLNLRPQQPVVTSGSDASRFCAPHAESAAPLWRKLARWSATWI